MVMLRFKPAIPLTKMFLFYPVASKQVRVYMSLYMQKHEFVHIYDIDSEIYTYNCVHIKLNVMKLPMLQGRCIPQIGSSKQPQDSSPENPWLFAARQRVID